MVSLTRDTALADRMMGQVRACSQAACALLVSTDGWAAYPNSIQRAFRDKIKRTEKKRVVEVTRKMTLGVLEQASRLLQASQGGTVLNTAFIERLNGTMRERLAALTRKCRYAARRLEALSNGMYLIGCTYNVCWPHHELSKTSHMGCACTPAMASGLTDHIWSVGEVLTYKVAPAPWVELKRRGRPRTRPMLDPNVPKRPRGRPRTHPLPDPTLAKRPRGRPRKLA